MTYVEQSLDPEETLLFEARFHWLCHVLALTALGVPVKLAMWIGRNTTEPATTILLGGSAVTFALLLRQVMPIWTTEIAVTDNRLIVKRGWLARSSDELQLKAIEQVNFSQGIIGRLLDVGRISVHGNGDDELRIPPVVNPIALIKVVEDASARLKLVSSPA
jgi:uncharacterized membrane protein YdbT with pleckstrin-like domain